MKPTPELIDELFIEKVLAARQRTMEQKFLAAGELHQAAVERACAGILIQDPNASEDQILQEIKRRFVISQVLESTN